MTRDVAHGMVKQIVGVLIIGGVIVGGGTYLEPWAQEYEVKQAISLACADLMRFSGPPPGEELKKGLTDKLTRANVRPKPENINLMYKKVPGKHICDVKVVYDTRTPWLGITSLKPDLPPLKLHHVVKVKKEVGDQW